VLYREQLMSSRLIISIRWAVAVTAAVGLVTLALPGSFAALAAPALATPTPTIVAPVTLSKLPAGWTAWSASPAFLTPHGTEVETIATSWGYRFSAPGPGPGNVIPPGGSMIDIMLLRSQAYRSHGVNLCSTAAVIAGHPRLTPPFTLPRTTTATSDGAPGVKEFRVFGRYRNYYNFEVRVNIDTGRPIHPRWRVADRVVSGLRFPTWPTRRIC
jgi:hypothetical protein